MVMARSLLENIRDTCVISIRIDQHGAELDAVWSYPLAQPQAHLMDLNQAGRDGRGEIGKNMEIEKWANKRRRTEIICLLVKYNSYSVATTDRPTVPYHLILEFPVKLRFLRNLRFSVPNSREY